MITQQARRALRAHQLKQADMLPDNSSMWVFMATGAFDPPLMDDITCDQDDTNTILRDALVRAGVASNFNSGRE